MRKALEAMETHTLSERVAERLRASIVSRTLRPGDVLVERAVAQELGVSQTAVREALLRLEKDGLVQRQRNKQTRVTILTPKEEEDAYGVRIPLETMAFTEAQKFLAPEIVQKASDLIAGMEEAAQQHDRAATETHDLEFHRLFWKLSGNETLLKLLEITCVPLFAFSAIERNWPTYLVDNPAFHIELLEAIQRGSEEEIRTAVRQHFRNVWDAVSASQV